MRACGGSVHEIQCFLSDDEMDRLERAAEVAGMTLDEYVTHAARSEFRARYVRPKIDGKILPFKALKRGKP